MEETSMFPLHVQKKKSQELAAVAVSMETVAAVTMVTAAAAVSKAGINRNCFFYKEGFGPLFFAQYPEYLTGYLCFMKHSSLLLFLVISLVSACKVTQNASKDDRKIEITYIQVNDVYEIATVSGGKEGGLARLATLKNQQLTSNPNTVMLMAGDYLSPSVFNSLKYQGKRVRGAQMVDAMNVAGFDLAVPGNHEFDISGDEFQQRLNESAFELIASNTFHRDGESMSPFKKYRNNDSIALPTYIIKSYTDKDGTMARIGYIGITLPFNKAEYVSYTDPLTTAKEIYNKISDSCDAVVAITHQEMEEDQRLADSLPGLALIMGGHEHDMRFEKRGNLFITKAHANARTAYLVNMKINKKKKTVEVVPQLVSINEQFDFEPKTKAIVDKWMNAADSSYSTLGFDANKVVYMGKDSLEARETIIRHGSSNFTEIIIRAMKEAAPESDAVIMNAGSIRLDDVLVAPVKQYDIIRSLPFGGGIQEVKMKGKLLKQVLMVGLQNKGIGGFLHTYPLAFDNVAGQWKLRDQLLEDEGIYRVAFTDFLLTGGEANMEFLTNTNPGIVEVLPVPTAVGHPQSDIRLAIINYLTKIGQTDSSTTD